jgi:YD repeat-containing protein
MPNTSSILYQVGQGVKNSISSALGKDDSFSEPVFNSGGDLTSLTTWTNSGKGTKVGSKAFTYTSGNLTSVVEKDGSDTTTLTKTLTYDAGGNLASITKDYA